LVPFSYFFTEALSRTLGFFSLNPFLPERNPSTLSYGLLPLLFFFFFENPLLEYSALTPQTLTVLKPFFSPLLRCCLVFSLYGLFFILLIFKLVVSSTVVQPDLILLLLFLVDWAVCFDFLVKFFPPQPLPPPPPRRSPLRWPVPFAL